MKSRIFFIAFLWLLVSCSQPEKDKDIKSMIATAAKADPAFAGVNYTVNKGIVTLSGSCPTQREKDKVTTRLSNTAGVKGTIDLIQLAPVTLNADFSLKQAVDSVLMKYARVQASVQDSVVTLHGEVENKKVQELLKAIHQLNPKGINHQLAAR